MGYDWNFAFLVPYAEAFLRAALLTLEVSLISFVLGTTIGIGAGVVLRALPFQGFFLLVNDSVRAIPVLVLLLFVYYFPYKDLLGVSAPSVVACTIIAMTIGQIVYTADIVRSAINGVSNQAILGGKAIGLRDMQITRFIVLPDVIRQTLPAQIAFLIGIIRLTSIASVIGCPEVVFVARISTSQNFRTLEAWLVVAALYVVMVIPLTVALRYLENSKWLLRRV